MAKKILITVGVLIVLSLFASLLYGEYYVANQTERYYMTVASEQSTKTAQHVSIAPTGIKKDVPGELELKMLDSGTVKGTNWRGLNQFQFTGTFTQYQDADNKVIVIYKLSIVGIGNVKIGCDASQLICSYLVP